MKANLLLVASSLLLTSCVTRPVSTTNVPSTPIETQTQSQPDRRSQPSKCEPKIISGYGTDIVDVSNQSGCRFVTASCDGDDNFVVTAYNSQGGYTNNILNEICGEDGHYSWKKIWNPDRELYSYIEVDVDRNWSLNVK